MSSTYPTLLDIAKANESDRAVGLIDEARRMVPEIDLIAARSVPGINYATFVRTTNPTVGFRKAGDGADAVTGSYVNRLVECFILDVPWQCDKAVADAYVDGPEAYIALEASGMVNAAMQRAAAQMWYGADANGFPAIAAKAASVVDAGGTTNNVASSIYAVQFGPQAVQWVIGNNGAFQVDDPIVQMVAGANGKQMKAYCQNLLIRIGLQVGNLNGVAKVKNVTTDAGKGCTDPLLADLVGKFPVGYKPDAIFMSRRSRTQLQKSRTATTPTGAAVPLPTDYDGIPIVATDSLVDTEALS